MAVSCLGGGVFARGKSSSSKRVRVETLNERKKAKMKLASRRKASLLESPSSAWALSGGRQSICFGESAYIRALSRDARLCSISFPNVPRLSIHTRGTHTNLYNSWDEEVITKTAPKMPLETEPPRNAITNESNRVFRRHLLEGWVTLELTVLS